MGWRGTGRATLARTLAAHATQVQQRHCCSRSTASRAAALRRRAPAGAFSAGIAAGSTNSACARGSARTAATCALPGSSAHACACAGRQTNRETERERDTHQLLTARQGQARGYATVSWSLASCNLGEGGGAPGGAYPQCAVTTISACASGSAEGRPTMPSAPRRRATARVGLDARARAALACARACSCHGQIMHAVARLAAAIVHVRARVHAVTYCGARARAGKSWARGRAHNAMRAKGLLRA